MIVNPIISFSIGGRPFFTADRSPLTGVKSFSIGGGSFFTADESPLTGVKSFSIGGGPFFGADESPLTGIKSVYTTERLFITGILFLENVKLFPVMGVAGIFLPAIYKFIPAT